MQPFEPRPPLEDDHLTDEQLLLYQAEKLSPADREQAEAHFRVCREGRCARRLRELWAGGSLGLGAGAETIPPVPPSLEDLGYTYEHEASGAIRTPPGVSARHDVYLAIRKSDELPVVVKFLPSARTEGGADPAQARLRFIEEPAATHQVGHDNIVRILDFHSVKGRFFYVMQYVGPSLSRYQGGVPFWDRLDLAEVKSAAAEAPTAPYVQAATPPLVESPAAESPRAATSGGAPPIERMQTLACWVIVLAKTIEATHRRNIIHRDLKPDNILVQEGAARHPEQLYIADFGILHHLNVSSTALEPTAIGTRNYMAPEQLDNKQRLSPATDIYGLGGVFFFMLTGRPPLLFSATEDWHKEDWKNRVRTEPPAPPRQLHPCIPVGLQAICMKALEKEPGRRYQSGAELAEDLQRFVDGRRPWAQYPPVLRGAVIWTRRNPRTARVFGLLSGLLALAMVFMATTWIWYMTAVTETVRAEGEKLRAETEKLRAEAEKRRAEKGEADAKREFREKIEKMARFALSRGQRLEALALYDRLLPDLPPAEQVWCRVERLPCLFAYSQWGRLHPELQELAKLQLPPKLRAQVLLHQGDVELWRLEVFPIAEGRKHLMAALSIKDGLLAADAEYARGLLADGSSPAIEHYKKALALDSFHPRARVNLLYELIFSGQFELAERELEIAAAYFPDEPLVPAAGALLTTLQQRPQQREPFLERLREQLPKKDFDKLKRIFLAVDVGLKALAPEADARALRAGWALFANPFRLVLDRELGPLVGVASPLVRRPVDMMSGLAWAHLRVTFGDNRGACRLCEDLSKNHPEAWIRVVHAAARLNLVSNHQKAGKWQEMYKELERSYELLAEARRSPTLISNMGIHRQAAWLCVTIQAGFWSEMQIASRSAAVALLQPPGLGSCPQLAAIQLNAGLTVLKHIPKYDRSWVFIAAMESHGSDAERSRFLPEIVFFLPLEDGRILLSDWEADEPKAIKPLELRARLEFTHGNWPEARRYAEKTLAKEPRNRDALKVLEQLRNLDQPRP